MVNFVHLHNHSHFSLLDGACRIDDLVAMAAELEMPALALTDHGNLFGAIEFYQKCLKSGVKPIVGSEVYVAPRSCHEKKSIPGIKGTSFHLVLLCKNEIGYKNLMKLVSLGYTEGFYYKPRVDIELLRTYNKGLVALSACLKGEVAGNILYRDLEHAREVVQKYRDIFGENFYLEVQDHNIVDEDKVRAGVFQLAAETGVKVVATNDIHYLQKEHWAAHDVLLCLQTGKDYGDPSRMRYTSHELYFKNTDEMMQLFHATPEVLENTMEVAEKCNLMMDFKTYHLPQFKIPESDEIKTLDDYLRKLAYVGLKSRYENLTPEIRKRLDYELSVIKQMGYAGYFLITYDFIKYAREKGIPVGPGRGSAAGSLVAYSLRITNLDPLKYGLLFERFLNPERVTMPDIDIDFCYERRPEVIEYVKNKYGYNNVCQIITFGTMAARAVIRDVGRVLNMSYGEVDRIAKLIPTQLNIKLKEALETVTELRDLVNQDETHQKLIQYSLVLEGLARHASTHAAGVVITPEELTNYVPLYKTKDDDLTTQYDMSVLEEVGLLKMDFLGLRTLTVIQKAIDAVRILGHNIDLETLPLNDPKVYELFGNGHTIGIFQFESSGMQEYMVKLQPECLEDLLAMNALYRPGPMDWIDDFIDRKKGRQKIEYDHPLLEPVLKDTYGIAVYQEQVMQMAVAVAGYSMGEADLLRRAMSKKKKEIMAQQRGVFVQRASENGVTKETGEKIFDDMAKFAKYGFNKSHAACYSLIAYQTAYLKAYFPAEFMAAAISSEMHSTTRVNILLTECRRMGLEILPPDINESYWDFVVKDGKIRFGLGAIKNVGEGAVDAVVQARNAGHRFKTIYDLCIKVSSSAMNKKVLESLVESGALDNLTGTRAQKFAAVETAVEFAGRQNAFSAHGQISMFDVAEEDETFAPPPFDEIPEWTEGELLKREKTVLGLYLSGHPLNKYRDEVNAFSTCTIQEANKKTEGTLVRICGVISEMKNLVDRQKRPMAFFRAEDFTGSVEAITFSDLFEKYREHIFVDSIVMVIGKVKPKDAETVKIMVDEVITLSDARERFMKNLCLTFDVDNTPQNLIREVKVILENFKGDIPVYINIVKNKDKNFITRSKTVGIKPDVNLVEQLSEKIGRENVWVGG
ncbi:DNA polymerase III subunit alpha [candidate division KSB1 bacterium]|nr:DNA polymerase III subunit alpha [candidate division KSB1 bacterium]